MESREEVILENFSRYRINIKKVNNNFYINFIAAGPTYHLNKSGIQKISEMRETDLPVEVFIRDVNFNGKIYHNLFINDQDELIPIGTIPNAGEIDLYEIIMANGETGFHATATLNDVIFGTNTQTVKVSIVVLSEMSEDEDTTEEVIENKLALEENSSDFLFSLPKDPLEKVLLNIKLQILSYLFIKEEINSIAQTISESILDIESEE